MSLTALTTNLDIIAALDDEPNDVSGLTSTEAKAKFDEGPNDIKNYINGTLIPELDAVHLPYDCAAEGGQTIKDAFDEATLGTLPDSSITAAKLSSAAYSTQAEAEDGTATAGIMNPLRTAQAITSLGLKAVTGTITGVASGSPQSVTLPGTPTCVLVRRKSTHGYALTTLLFGGDTQDVLWNNGGNEIVRASLSGTTLTLTWNLGSTSAIVFNYVSFYL